MLATRSITEPKWADIYVATRRNSSIRWNLATDHSSSADNDIRADTRPIKNDCVRPQPYVVAYVNSAASRTLKHIGESLVAVVVVGCDYCRTAANHDIVSNDYTPMTVNHHALPQCQVPTGRDSPPVCVQVSAFLQIATFIKTYTKYRR